MPSEQVIQACKDLGLDTDALYDTNAACNALQIAPVTLKCHRIDGKIKCEQTNGRLTGYRGWHIAERHINRRGRET